MIKEDFNEYMESFKKLTLKEKQDIIIEQLKLISSLVGKMCESEDIKSEFLFNKEIIDLNKEEYTEDDFAEALIVYINIIQNTLCDYNIK